MPRIENTPRPWITKPEGRNEKHDPFYDTPAWRKLRKVIIMKKPLCEACKKEGIITAAKIIDHNKPKEIFPELALEEENMNSLCEGHHSKKSALERGVRTREQWNQVFKDKETVIQMLIK